MALAPLTIRQARVSSKWTPTMVDGSNEPGYVDLVLSREPTTTELYVLGKLRSMGSYTLNDSADPVIQVKLTPTEAAEQAHSLIEKVSTVSSLAAELEARWASLVAEGNDKLRDFGFL